MNTIPFLYIHPQQLLTYSPHSEPSCENSAIKSRASFNTLPLELRRAIYVDVAEARILTIKPKAAEKDGSQTASNTCSSTYRLVALTGPIIPKLLHINRESRQFALETYQATFTTLSTSAIYLNSSIDSLYFGHSQEMIPLLGQAHCTSFSHSGRGDCGCVSLPDGDESHLLSKVRHLTVIKWDNRKGDTRVSLDNFWDLEKVVLGYDLDRMDTPHPLWHPTWVYEDMYNHPQRFAFGVKPPRYVFMPEEEVRNMIESETGLVKMTPRAQMNVDMVRLGMFDAFAKRHWAAWCDSALRNEVWKALRALHI